MKYRFYISIFGLLVCSCTQKKVSISNAQYKTLLTEAFSSKDFYPQFKALGRDSINVAFNKKFSGIIKINKTVLFVNRSRFKNNKLETVTAKVDSISANEKSLKIITQKHATPSSQLYGEFILQKNNQQWNVKYVTSGFYDYR